MIDLNAFLHPVINRQTTLAAQPPHTSSDPAATFQKELDTAAQAPESAETPPAHPAATPEPPPALPAPVTPTLDSVFGSNPWVADPAGFGPFGQFTFNPIYFATQATAEKVASMLGGKVVETNAIVNQGGPFAQQQSNLMVQLPNGRMVNAGLVAAYYTHGYPQSYIDHLIAAEVAGTNA